MRTGLPPGLQAILQKLGVSGALGGKPGAEVVAKALHAEAPKDPKGLAKGTVLGEDGALLAGLGYNPEDRQTALKNVQEKASVDRFLHDAKDTKDAAPLPPREAETAAAEHPTAGRDAVEREGRELRELRDEIRREDRIDDAHLQSLKDARNTEETRQTRETSEKEREQERQRDDKEDDREKHGSGWVLEEQEQEENPKKRRAIRLDDALGDHTRCFGTLEDGTRCLRRPTPGTPYCLEHAVSGTYRG